MEFDVYYVFFCPSITKLGITVLIREAGAFLFLMLNEWVERMVRMHVNRFHARSPHVHTDGGCMGRKSYHTTANALEAFW